MAKRRPLRPPLRAPIDQWRAFAIGQGMAKRDAEQAKKKDLIALYAQPAAKSEPEPSKADTTPDPRGDVERSTAEDLQNAGIASSALGRSALKLARHVDGAVSGAEAAAAARELRMTLATAYSLAKPLSPLSGTNNGADGDDEEGDGVLVGADRLAAAREAAARAQNKRRTR